MTGADFRVGRQRPLDVEDRRQERLGLIEGAAEDETDAAAFATLVQEADRAGRAFADDFDPRDGVPDFGRRIERHLSAGGVGRESEMCIREREILKIEGTQRSAVPSVRFCAHQLGAELPAGILDARDRERTGALRFDDGDAIAGDELRQGRHKTLLIRPRDPVTDPDDLRIRRRLKETADRIQMGLPVWKNGLRHKRAQALQGRSRACQR